MFLGKIPWETYSYVNTTIRAVLASADERVHMKDGVVILC